MKVFIPFLVCLFLFFKCSPATRHQVFEHHSVAKRSQASKTEVAMSIAELTISLATEIASQLVDSSNWANIENELKDIKAKLDHTTDLLTNIETLLKDLHKKLTYFDYDRVITDAKEKISHCFDYVEPLYDESSTDQARRELRSCNPDQKSKVKQIGDILTGKAIGTHARLLFDQVIHDRGYCNGSDMLGLRDYLSVLFSKGCAVMIVTEYLEYGNSTSFIDRNYCTTTLQEMDQYLKALFGRCSNESVGTRNKIFQTIMTDVASTKQAFSTLNATFPWFKFSLIKSKCSEGCKIKQFGSDHCKIRTFDGKTGHFYILIFDVKQTDMEDTGDRFGIEISRECVLDDQFEGFNTIDGLPTTAYFALRKHTDKESCVKAEAKCQDISSGTRALETSNVPLLISIILLTLKMPF